MMRSMYSGVAGLKTHQTKMDVIGNNIANVNTTSYKSQSINFSDLMYQTTQNASGATETRGGVNARQIGLGAVSAAISTAITTQGAAQTTNNPFDIMITGESFFIVNNGVSNVYTRDGSFYVDGAGNLAMQSNGYYVMGWEATTDETTGITSVNKNGGLSKLQIMSEENQTYPPEGTSQAVISGNIDAKDSNVTSSAGKTVSMEFYDNLGYLYTAKFTVKDTDQEHEYTIQLSDILDSEGNSVGNEILNQVTMGSTEDADDEYALNRNYYVSSYTNGGDVVFAGTNGNDVTITPSYGSLENNGDVKTALSTLYGIDFADDEFKNYATGTYSIESDGTLTLSDSNLYTYPEDGTALHWKVNPTITSTTGNVSTIKDQLEVLYGLDIDTDLADYATGTYAIDENNAVTLTKDDSDTYNFITNFDSTNFSSTKKYSILNFYGVTSLPDGSTLDENTDLDGVTLDLAADGTLTYSMDDGSGTATLISDTATLADTNGDLDDGAKTVLNALYGVTFSNDSKIEYGTYNIDGGELTVNYKTSTDAYSRKVNIEFDGQDEITGSLDKAMRTSLSTLYDIDWDSEPYSTYKNGSYTLTSGGDLTLTTTTSGENTITFSRNVTNLSFDPTTGNITDPGSKKVALNFGNVSTDATGGFTNMELDFSTLTNVNTSGSSTIKASKGDLASNNTGRRVGTMNGITVSVNGAINATYTNGQTRLLGQIAVAEFSNASGLEKQGDNLYASTLNSGDPTVMEITEDGGSMTTGVLEMSNVDLSTEFTNMITAQRGFQANSRIITVSDTLLEELTNLKR